MNGIDNRSMRPAVRIAWIVPGLLAFSAASAQEAPQIESLQQRLAELERRGDEWRTRDSVFHVAGYADARYADRSGGESGFDLVSFNPIFHYQYRERILLEAELETSIDADGESELAVEYSTVGVILGDHAALVAGKFLSPIGYFQQNIHPSWINKLPSEPPGFGHDGAAPATEVGLQLRGGFQFAERGLWTYAVYVGNGPELEAEEGRLTAVEAEGFTRDADGSKVFGGRVSAIPVGNFELGVSLASGRAAVTTGDDEEVADDPDRDYTAYGADFSWRLGKSWDLRGEYVRQEVGAAAASVAPGDADWAAWYAQASYRWPETAWEFVVRYGEFSAPDEAMEQEQTAFGVNYLFGPGAMAKFGYELNDGAAGEDAGRNRWLLQLAYGF